MVMEQNQLTQYVGSTCLVYNDTSELLFSGEVASYSNTLRVNVIYDADTSCPYWTLKPASKIYLRLQDEQDSKQFIMLHGMVVNATNDHFFMLPQFITYKSNEREYFRQSVQLQTTVSFHNGQPVQHDGTIVDISAGGLCLHSMMNYQIGDSIQIVGQQLHFSGPAHDLDCVVVRKTPQRNAMQPNVYGCSFRYLDEGHLERLFSDIFVLQCSKIHTN